MMSMDSADSPGEESGQSESSTATDMPTRDAVRLSVVMERRSLQNRWASHTWRPIAVVPGAPAMPDWAELRSGDGWAQYHARSIDLQLFRRETEGYKRNLSQPRPAVFVVLRPTEPGDGNPHDIEVFHLTACPYEAASYEISGEEQVEAVAMPDPVRQWVQAFVQAHHRDEEFYKRKRKPYDPRKGRVAGMPPGRVPDSTD